MITNKKICKVFLGSKNLYSAGSTVTYVVDSGTMYTEEVSSGKTCLAPTTFTPSKSGWTFVGWREDTVANGDTLTSKIMQSSPVVLYAVYKQDITVTYYNNSTSASTTKGSRYYNGSGTMVNPSFTLAQAGRSGMTARGWSTSNDGNGAITYNNNTAFTRDSNITLYGLYQQTITVTYYNNSTTAKTTTGTRYWAPAGYINPSFTLSQAAKSGWSYRGWSTSNAANANINDNITYGNVDVQNTTFTRDSNITLYGIYYQVVSLTYNGNGASNGSVDGYWTWRMYNSSGKTYNPTTTLKANGFSRMDYSFNGWDLGAVGATVTLDGDKVAYAQWKQLSLTLFNGGTFYHNFDVLTEHGDADGLNYDEGQYANWNKNSGLYMAAYAYAYKIAWITTAKIDVTNLKTLNFTISGLTCYGVATWMIGLQSERKTVADWNLGTVKHNGGYGNGLTNGQTISLDVSSMTGSYYVTIQIDSGNRQTLGFTATNGWFDAK